MLENMMRGLFSVLLMLVMMVFAPSVAGADGAEEIVGPVETTDSATVTTANSTTTVLTTAQSTTTIADTTTVPATTTPDPTTTVLETTTTLSQPVVTTTTKPTAKVEGPYTNEHFDGIIYGYLNRKVEVFVGCDNVLVANHTGSQIVIEVNGTILQPSNAKRFDYAGDSLRVVVTHVFSLEDFGTGVLFDITVERYCQSATTTTEAPTTTTPPTTAPPTTAPPTTEAPTTTIVVPSTTEPPTTIVRPTTTIPSTTQPESTTPSTTTPSTTRPEPADIIADFNETVDGCKLVAIGSVDAENVLRIDFGAILLPAGCSLPATVTVKVDGAPEGTETFWNNGRIEFGDNGEAIPFVVSTDSGGISISLLPPAGSDIEATITVAIDAVAAQPVPATPVPAPQEIGAELGIITDGCVVTGKLRVIGSNVGSVDFGNIKLPEGCEGPLSTRIMFVGAPDGAVVTYNNAEALVDRSGSTGILAVQNVNSGNSVHYDVRFGEGQDVDFIVEITLVGTPVVDTSTTSDTVQPAVTPRTSDDPGIMKTDIVGFPESLDSWEARIFASFMTYKWLLIVLAGAVCLSRKRSARKGLAS